MRNKTLSAHRSKKLKLTVRPLFFPSCQNRQWLSCAHIGLGAFLTFASNLSSLLSVQLILKFYLGQIVNETFALDSMSILIYTCAYSLPIVLASVLCYFFLPEDKEVHWKWKVLALCLLVTFSGLAFIFVGNSPLGMTIDPLDLFYGRKPKVSKRKKFMKAPPY